jgi:cyclopropane-fatty-acyl-phospholipid synthase
MPATTVEDITGHYARTLEIWRERYNDAAPDLARLGYDERFRRLWNFYLAVSEGGFRERRIRDLQIVLAKPGWLAEENGWPSATPVEAQASLSS